MDSTRPDYYQIIGVATDDDVEMIKRHFVDKARLLIEAYQVLTDKEARAQYDNEVEFGAQAPNTETESVAPRFPIPADALALQEPDKNLRNLVVSLDGRTMLAGKKITKRLLSRIPVNTPVAVHLPDGSVRDGWLRDLSGTGARVSIRADLTIDGVLEISVDRESPPFVLAQVVRVVRAGEEFGVKWIQVFERRLPKGMLSDETL